MARVIRRWRAAVALAVATAAAVVGSPPGGGGVAAHSSCRSPLESTWSNSCRIGGINGAWKNCPGPCPRDPDRKNYRVEQFRRGQWIPFVYYKNNHSGTFWVVGAEVRMRAVQALVWVCCVLLRCMARGVGPRRAADSAVQRQHQPLPLAHIV